MDKDHTYDISSTQGNEVFSEKWSTINEDYLTDQTLAEMNLESSVDQDAWASSSNSAGVHAFPSDNIVPVDLSHCEELFNAILSNKNLPLPETEFMELTSTKNTTHGISSLPASENWPGIYDFSVSFNSQSTKKKGTMWNYVAEKDKLYVGKSTPCPINFSTMCTLSDNVKIRAMALYSSPDSVSEVVERCLNHTREDQNQNILEAAHLVRCESPMAEYEIDPVTRRYSVIVPYENPPVGQSYSSYIYKFACFGSCPGPNRRPLMLVFTLEENGQVIGRRKLDLKICACPARDSQQSNSTVNVSGFNKRKIKKEIEDSLSIKPSAHRSKKVKISQNQEDEEGNLTIKVKDPKCYEFLTQMKKYFEIMKTMKNMPPSVKKVLNDYNKRKGINFTLG